MRLRPGTYLILGMLRAGVGTGYAIKQAVDRSTRFFWAASLAQVYPELARLQSAGYASSSEEPRGARPRTVYSLTDKGEEALLGWLRSERVPAFEFRDEGMLRLFFADILDADEAVSLVRRLREDAEKTDATFRREVLPAAEQAPFRFPAITARWGADYYTWRAQWLRALEEDLEAPEGG